MLALTFALMISQKFENDIGSKTGSAGQILQIPCVSSLGHIFSPLLLKLVHNVFLDDI